MRTVLQNIETPKILGNRVQQMLVDTEQHNDWVAEFAVDLAESRAAGEPVVRLRRVGSLA